MASSSSLSSPPSSSSYKAQASALNPGLERITLKLSDKYGPDDEGKRKRSLNKPRLSREQLQLLEDPEVKRRTDSLGREAVRLYDGANLTIRAIAEKTGGRLADSGQGFAKHYHRARAVIDETWAARMSDKKETQDAPDASGSQVATTAAMAAPSQHALSSNEAPLATASARSYSLASSAPGDVDESLVTPSADADTATTPAMSASGKLALAGMAAAKATSSGVIAAKPPRNKKGKGRATPAPKQPPQPAANADRNRPVTFLETPRAAEIVEENKFNEEAAREKLPKAFRDPSMHRKLADTTSDPELAKKILASQADLLGLLKPKTKEERQAIMEKHGGSWQEFEEVYRELQLMAGAELRARVSEVGYHLGKAEDLKTDLARIKGLRARNMDKWKVAQDKRAAKAAAREAHAAALQAGSIQGAAGQPTEEEQFQTPTTVAPAMSLAPTGDGDENQDKDKVEAQQ